LDRSPVTRELALGLIGDRLEELETVALPVVPSAAPSPEQIDAARARLEGSANRPASSDLSALDLFSTRQMLEELAGQLRRSAPTAQQSKALDELTRRTLGLTLRAALEDPQDWVRARAARLALPLDSSLAQPLLETALDAEQPLTIQAVAEFLAESQTLPAGLDAKDWRERLIASVDYPDDRASVAAARALSSLYPEAGRSLRPEDWLLWWELSRRPAETSGDPAATQAPKEASDGS
jgi:hypothetical protein